MDLDRRKFMVAGGAAATLALAGCAAEDLEDAEANETAATSPPVLADVPMPPTEFDYDGENAGWAYVFESLHYQNMALAALVDDAR